MKRFYSVSDFYKKKFGCKVYKISLDAGCTCPNRDGTKSFGGCIFCSGSGSGDFAADKNLSIAEQIIQAKQRVLSKNKDGKFIAYFQNFSNTYGNAKELAKKYNAVFEYNDFFKPDVFENEEILNERINFYKGLDRDRSKDTLHGIFLDLCISSMDTTIREYSKKRIAQSMEIADKLGVKGVVFHTGLIGGLTVDYYIERTKDCRKLRT